GHVPSRARRRSISAARPALADRRRDAMVPRQGPPGGPGHALAGRGRGGHRGGGGSPPRRPGRRPRGHARDPSSPVPPSGGSMSLAALCLGIASVALGAVVTAPFFWLVAFLSVPVAVTGVVVSLLAFFQLVRLRRAGRPIETGS